MSPLAAGSPARWRAFLEALGVTHGLTPSAVAPARSRLVGASVNSPRLAQGYGPGVPLAETKPWRLHAQARLRGRVQFETTEYTPVGGAAALPGQWDWERFGHRSKADYAHLVVAGLTSWADAAFEMEFARHTDDRRAWWPSPLAYFLATRAWVPQTTPGSRSEILLSLPADAWWVEDVETPDFLPAQPPVLRAVADRAAIARLTSFGVRVWDDPTSAADRLAELAGHVGGRALESRTVAALAVRKANEGAWRDLVDHNLGGPPAQVVVMRRGELGTAVLGAETCTCRTGPASPRRSCSPRRACRCCR